MHKGLEMKTSILLFFICNTLTAQHVGYVPLHCPFQIIFDYVVCKNEETNALGLGVCRLYFTYSN